MAPPLAEGQSLLPMSRAPHQTYQPPIAPPFPLTTAAPPLTRHDSFSSLSVGRSPPTPPIRHPPPLHSICPASRNPKSGLESEERQLHQPIHPASSALGREAESSVRVADRLQDGVDRGRAGEGGLAKDMS
ncbi:hypothetical protein ACJRO7_000685 [Eucalyptus globulus]|uniref:Uncharacterized protein n=1 Tax=Eucalyptus globulus TaxID=34317 RepID=A0ABD3LPN3_EUCGL